MDPMSAAIAHLAPGMEPVARAFERMLADGREPGGEVAVFRDGEPLLIARGGTADATGRPWLPGTLVQVFSTGKAIAAAAALTAVADGLLALDDPIVAHWPEYRDDPAQPTTLRRLLAHRAGKFAFPDAVADERPFDRDALIAGLAAAEPEFPEGLGSVEHATTYGHLIDGVLRAVGAPSVAQTAARLGELVGATFRFGVPEAELDRVAELELIDPAWVDPYLGSGPARRALTRPRDVLDPAALNRAEWRRTSFPAVGLHTDAVSLARWYDDLGRSASADGERGGRLRGRLGSELLREAVTGQGVTLDGFSGEVNWALGMRADAAASGGTEVGMGGIGGSAAWYTQGRGGADAGGQRDYAMAYVTRGLGTHERVDELADLVEAALDRA